MPITLFSRRASNAATASSLRTFIWADSAADGDFSNAVNYGEFLPPASSDRVIINASSRRINTGLGQSTKVLRSLEIGPEYTGDLGPLEINADQVYIKKTSGSVDLVGYAKKVYIQSTAPGKDAVTMSGEIDDLYLISGNVELATQSVARNIYLCGSKQKRSTVRLSPCGPGRCCSSTSSRPCWWRRRDSKRPRPCCGSIILRKV